MCRRPHGRIFPGPFCNLSFLLGRRDGLFCSISSFAYKQIVSVSRAMNSKLILKKWLLWLKSQLRSDRGGNGAYGPVGADEAHRGAAGGAADPGAAFGMTGRQQSCL